jgi:electron transport complex protein RnfB
MSNNPYRRLAERLDALPNGFPPAEDGAELRLLAKLFTAEEAAIAAELRLLLETPTELAGRLDADPKELKSHLKGMAQRGLVAWGKKDGRIGYRLLPFVVGIYEYQVNTIDAELAQLFEDYYQQVFTEVLKVEPQVHRVVPIGESVQTGMEIRPYESATSIVEGAKSWAVTDCICRKQKTLIGDPCEHPLDVCMIMSQQPNAFDNSPTLRSLTQREAQMTLHRAANEGLVHSVSNSQEGLWYICNCCTCSCGILRGMAEMGIANVVAKSAFVSQVDEDFCFACEDCLDYCQFDALTMSDTVEINEIRCVGCGLCVLACPDEALTLVRRPEDEILKTPVTERDWMEVRAFERGIEITAVL